MNDNELEIVCLQVFLKHDENFKVNMKFHNSIEKEQAIDLLEMAIEDLKEVNINEHGEM